jgi:hypothetical protein
LATRLITLLVALAALAMLATGCGGDDEASSAEVTTSSLNKAAFTKKAIRICGKGFRKAQLGLANVGTSGGESQAEAEKSKAQGLAVTLVPAFRRVAVDIRALGAPKGDEETIGEFLEALQEGLDTVEENRASYTSVEQLEEPLIPAGELALSYGIPTCAFGT